LSILFVVRFARWPCRICQSLLVTFFVSFSEPQKSDIARFNISNISREEYIRNRFRKKQSLYIHVEAEITKGKYGNFDTFLSLKAVNLFKAYLELRRRGSPCGKISPETITDDSPLIRNSQGKTQDQYVRSKSTISSTIYTLKLICWRNLRELTDIRFVLTAYGSSSEHK